MCSSHRDEPSDFAIAASIFASPEMLVSSRAVGVLRARAARYTELAKTLSDPRVIAAVEACARDLEAEATLICQGMDR